MAGTAGGIGALLQGFIAGHQAGQQFKLQKQESDQNQKIKQQELDQSQAEFEQRKTAFQTQQAHADYATYQALARAHPNAIKTPEAIAAINQKLAPLGMGDVSKSIMDGTFGNIDPSELAENPARLEALNTLAPDQKQALRPTLGDALGKDWYDSAPTLTPQEIHQNYTSAVAAARPYLTDSSVANSPDGIAARQEVEHYAALAEHRPERQVGKMAVSAREAGQVATTGLRGAETEKTKAQTAGVETRNAFIAPLAQASIDEKKANTGLTREKTEFLPAEVRAKTDVAEASVARARQGQARLDMEVSRFKAMPLGPQSLNALGGLVKTVQAQQNQERLAAANAQSAATALLDPATKKPPKDEKQLALYNGYLSLANAARKREQTYGDTAQKMLAGKGQYAQQVMAAQGAPSSYKAPAAQADTGRVSKAASVISGMPPAQARAVLGKSSLSNAEKAQVWSTYSGAGP